MKKILTVLVALLFTAVGLFANSSEDLAEKIAAKAQTAKPSNKGAIEEHQRVDFEIRESLTDTRYIYGDDEYFEPNYELAKRGPYRADIACKAFALDKHWLILAGTCMEYSSGDIFEQGDSEYIERHSREVVNSSFGGKETKFARDGAVMLMWSEKGNFKGPYVNVLAVDSPKRLFSLTANHTIKINTARFGTNAIRTRNLLPNSVKGRTFKLDEAATDLSGTATDPLFLIAADSNEYLSGYNMAEISYALQITMDDFFHTYDGLTSDTWFTLSKEDLEFIRKTVTSKMPEDWNNIQKRLFYNNTDKPYFSK